MSVGVYLPNMEMPKDCLKCPFCLFADGYWKCLVNGSHADFGGTCRPSLCPLVPVQPHGRLGDLDKLEQMFIDIDNAPYSSFDGLEPFYSAEDAAQIIRLSPTIISAVEGET